MTADQIIPAYETAEALRKEGKYQIAAQEFEQIWQKSPSPSVGWRWAFCDRKLGLLSKAEQIIRGVLLKFPADKWVVSEFGWVLYDKEIKPGMEEKNLGKILHSANEIWQYNPTDLLLTKLVMAVSKVAAKCSKWDVVLEWTGRVQILQLDNKPFIYEGKKGMSDREAWYIRRSRALLELNKYNEARQIAQEGLGEFPKELYLGRNAALALAKSGDIAGGADELRQLLHHPRADAYLKADLGELEFRQGNLDEANRLLCEAVLNPQSNQYKLGYYLILAELYLAMEKPVAAAESLALAKAVRQKEDWPIPSRLNQLEQETLKKLNNQGQVWPTLPDDIRSLSRLCEEHWKAESKVDLKRVTGFVGRLDPGKAYTHLARYDGEESVYALIRDMPKECVEGCRVEFSVKPSFDNKKNKESLKAVDVRCIKK